MLRAVIFDIDGTVAETERDGHRVAFNQAFEAAGLARRWDEATYGRLLEVTGGRERLLHDLAGHPGVPSRAEARDAWVRDLHRHKNRLYAERLALRGIPLRPGVRALMDACLDEGVRLGIATTTSRPNVEALLAAEFGVAWAERFDAIVCGEDAPRKKPDPSVYLLALERLGCAPEEVVAIEDAPNGLAAARAAGITTLVTPSVYFADRAFDGARAIRAQLDDSGFAQLEELRGWA